MEEARGRSTGGAPSIQICCPSSNDLMQPGTLAAASEPTLRPVDDWRASSVSSKELTRTVPFT